MGDRDFGFTCGILILRLKEHDIAIEGGARTFVAQHAGQLFFYVNDENPGNNEGAYSVTVTTWSPVELDADGDGLDDSFEDALLDFYAPQYRFALNEQVWPCDAWWFLRNSELENCGWQPPSPSRAPFFAEWVLAAVDGCNPNISANFLDHSGPTDIAPNPEGDFTGNGVPSERITSARGIGLYGHAVREGDAIRLQYWQFYPFNDIDIDFLPDYGEHEGDWELTEVLVNAADPFNPDRMLEARWYAHKTAPPAVVWNATGGWRTRAIPGESIGDRLGDWPGMPVQHVPVFIERGSHGSWPTQWRFNEFVGGNNGQGHSFVPDSVQNLGEVYRPRLGMEIVLQFNGRWGKFTEADPFGFVDPTPPRGPVQQVWPAAGPSSEVRYVGKWNHGSPLPTGVTPPAGRISWPHQAMSEAAAANAADPRSEMHLYPGHYPGAVTISIPTIIRAPYGDVAIGK